MSTAESIQELATKVRQQKPAIETEEATKNAFVMPFIGNVLGFDVFNPREVVPEFTADVGVKRGEKIDYALKCGGNVQILIESKKVSEPLRLEHAGQLFRYFSVTNARIAILTNGEVYEFYTDLDAPNKMDDRPFLTLDLGAVDWSLIPEVAKLRKDSFDLDSIVNAAGELKYIGQIRKVLAAEFKEPTDEWIRFLGSRVYWGKQFNQRVREQFAPLVAKAANQFLTEQINERLKTALGPESHAEAPSVDQTQPARASSPDGVTETQEPTVNGEDVETTEEEMDGLRIVRAIACSEVSASRVMGRDAKTYYAIILDDNNRKPIARLWFNRAQKYIGIFDAAKKETRQSIESPEDIYRYANELRASVRNYSTAPSAAEA